MDQRPGYAGGYLTWNKENKTMNFRSRIKWQIVLFTVLVVALSPLVSQADSSAAKPVLEIPSPRYDAGIHWEGEKVSNTFQVKNSGSEELRILSVKPG